jgi:hypothetical protein
VAHNRTIEQHPRPLEQKHAAEQASRTDVTIPLPATTQEKSEPQLLPQASRANSGDLIQNVGGIMG